MKPGHKRVFTFLSLALALALLGAALAAAEINLPSTPQDYVVDLAGIIDPGVRQRLDGYLQELERKTSAQVVVLTVPDLNGRPIEDFSLSVAEKWKLGQKGKDNGALLLVALKERRYRFEIGYGLEGSLPDSFVGTLGREYLVPNFKRGDYSTGIALAVTAVAQKIAQDSGVRISGLENAPAPLETGTQGGTENTFSLIIAGIFFLIVFGLFLRHPGLFLLYLLGGGGGFGGGGFGGGGFGGGGSFGGGGGGGFGGGGASGGW
ncbi:MAG: TPM domain-containing protein [Nitrospiraceae bacterium]|nr:TPM domain-containing protein [Nitrospiraceae bacterium]